jgi:hypothetical protein
MSQDAVSAEEFRALKATMDRLRKYGLQNVASDAAGAEMPGAMADSSKRLRDDSVASFDMAFDDESWDLPCGGVLTGSSAIGGQQVISPKVLSSQTVELPPGVSSIKEWGKTLCELPAVARQKLSYEALAQDESQTDYLLWILKQGASKGPRVADLANYLQAIKFTEKCNGLATGPPYPGSNVVRKFAS